MNRRNFTHTATALSAGGLLSACASVQPAATAPRTYVLVHGAYHGGWCWNEVARQLRSQGHTVYTPTQTGLGERRHLAAVRPTMDVFIEDITQVLATEDLNNVILVGHSFGGSAVSGVADRMPERLRHLVYLDTLLLTNGQATFDGLPRETVERYVRQAQETSNGLTIPPPPPAYFGITDPAQAAWLSRRLSPHPIQSYVSPLNLQAPLGTKVPVTYIACSKPYFAATAKARETAKASSWTYQEIACSHDAMLVMPEELSRMLGAIGA